MMNLLVKTVMLIFAGLWFDDFSVGLAEEPQPDSETNAFLERVRAENNLVGLACCVIRHGKIVALGAVGLRKIGETDKLTVHDRLHLGSCTKAMTATVAAQLVEEKKIEWDTRLVDVFTNLQRKIHPEYHEITLLDLLMHQSGVPKNNVGGWPEGKRLRTTRFKLIQQSLAPKPENQVGDYHYSNLGYITAGAMLEKVTHQSWEQLIQDRLFRPLEMNSAGFGPPGKAYFKPEARRINGESRIAEPWGHRHDKEGKWVSSQLDNPPILGPAGTVHCSIVDWAKFLSLHVSPNQSGHGLLTAEALQFLHQPHSSRGNACGWFSVTRDWGGGPVITHNGTNTSWMANVWASPQKKFAVLTVTNGYTDDMAKTLDQVAVRMVNKFAH